MVPKVGLNPKALSSVGDVQGAYVRGPGGPNALPAMMRRKFIGDASGKVVRLADIYRVPLTLPERPAEDVNTRAGMVRNAERIQLKLITRSGCAEPEDGFRRD